MYKNNMFLNKFNGKDKIAINKFFQKLDSILEINKKEKKKFFYDFEKVIDYYIGNHKSINEIIKILDIDRLKSGFKNSNSWYHLDTSSKIYPLSMGEEWMSIYRLSLYLKDDINPLVLQIALLFTIVRFPIFKTSLKSGFFWNYLDNINKHYIITEENDIPTSFINISKTKHQLFRVIYYQNRISCEFFHVLADAYGGSSFLTTLVNEYLRLLGNKVEYNDLVLKIDSEINQEELIDMFQKIEVNNDIHGGLIEKKALSLDGRMSVVKPCQIIHYDLDFHKLHQLAKEKDVTINELVLSILFMVLSYSTSRDGFIKIQVPVNMRKYYPSKTLRNFSLYNTISIKKKDITNIDNVLEEVKKQSREKLTKEVLNGVMYHAKKLVSGVSCIPLFIKRPIAKFIYKYFGDTGCTTVLSNLGKINLPSMMEEKIIKGDFVLGTTMSNKILTTLITINDITTLTISKFTSNSSFENNLYSLLKEYDLIINVHGSDKYEIRK